MSENSVAVDLNRPEAGWLGGDGNVPDPIPARAGLTRDSIGIARLSPVQGDREMNLEQYNQSAGNNRKSKAVYAIAWVVGIAASAAVIWLIESLS
jgi:hypothetical protein